MLGFSPIASFPLSFEPGLAVPVVVKRDTHDLPPDYYWLESDYLDEIKEAAEEARKAQDHNRKARRLAKDELRQALERAVHGAPDDDQAEAFLEALAPEAIVKPGYEIDWTPVIGGVQGLRSLLRRIERESFNTSVELEKMRAEEDDIELLLIAING